MAAVENFSDSELRRRLMQYGVTVGPVTETTRKIFQRKLKDLMTQSGGSGNDSTKNRRTRSSLSRFSSGEEDSDIDEKKKNRARMSMPAPKSPVIIQKRKSTGGINVSSDKPAQSTRFSLLGPTTSPQRSLFDKTAPTISKRSIYPDNFDSGSDSDTGDNNLKGDKQKIGLSDKPFASSFLNRLTSARMHKPSSTDPDIPSSSTYDILRSRRSSGIGQSHTPDYLNFSRSFSSSHLGEARSSTPAAGVLGPRSIYDVKETDVAEDDSHLSSSPNGLYSSQGYPRSRFLSREFRSLNEDKKTWPNSYFISKLILGVVILFFFFLGLVYFIMRTKDAGTAVSVETENDVYPFCNPEKSIVPCIEKSTFEATRRLLNPLYIELSKRRVRELCESEVGPPALMGHSEMFHWLRNHPYTRDVSDIESHLKNLKVLVVSNPHWGISVIPPDKVGGSSSHEDVVNMKDLIAHGGMMVENPSLPLGCTVRTKLVTIISSLVFVVAGVVLIYGGTHAGTMYLEYRKRSMTEVYSMVERILDFLATHHRDSPRGYLAVNHVRDQLIAPPDRKRLFWVWQEAVKFIQNNESRVRSEMQQVAGEQCLVWRWLGSSVSPGLSASEPGMSGNQLGRRTNKVWQGQAFEMVDGSPNHLNCSPTPCLKLRHMFNPETEYGDEWMVKIKDAILEKCEGIPILHIAVDKASNEGCVYLKCATSDDAGRAYHKLHGSWFDNDLVTVKYLRVERYYQRFPESVRALSPLTPSNNKKLSLQSSARHSSSEFYHDD